MSAVLAAMLPAAVLMVVVPVLLVILAATARPDAELLPATAAARRHAVLGGAAAVLVAAATAFLLATLAAPALGVWAPGLLGSPGSGLAIVPAAAGLAHTAVLALTERTWPRPTGAVRRAALNPRSVGDLAPRLRRVLHATVLVTAVVVLAGALLADDDQTSIRVSLRDASGAVIGSHAASPFPGLRYGLPALIGVLLLTAAVEAALRLVVNRPAVPGADQVTDTALRRASAHRLLRGALAAVLLTLGPLCLVGGTTAVRVLDGAAAAASTVAAAGGLLVVVALVVLCWPAPRVPAPAPPQPAPGREPARP
jgi:hypothetical protein